MAAQVKEKYKGKKIAVHVQKDSRHAKKILLDTASKEDLALLLSMNHYAVEAEKPGSPGKK